jgi:alpha-tubulin suppressor-like RCC1 family protein
MLRRVLATWGNADCGRLGHDALVASVEIPRVLTPLLDLRITGVTAGGAHTAAVTSDGAVLTFGLNDRGQLGHSAGQVEARVPQEVAIPEPAVAVAAGHYFTLCVTESGRVWAWGDNTHGQLGVGGDAGAGSSQPRLVAALRGVSIAGVAAGAEHALAVSSSGEVFTWGCGAAGRLGHGAPAALRLAALRDEAKPRVVRALETQRVRHVAAGQLHSACVSEEGVLFAFGGGRFHQLGLGADADEVGPREVCEERDPTPPAT